MIEPYSTCRKVFELYIVCHSGYDSWFEIAGKGTGIPGPILSMIKGSLYFRTLDRGPGEEESLRLGLNCSMNTFWQKRDKMENH